MFGGISGQLLDLAHAFFDGVRIASKDVGDVADPAMAEFDRFDGRKAAAILFGETLVVLPQELFDCWRVGFLKGKHQDASSISPDLQGMRYADRKVCMSGSKNASCHESGNYFGVIPYRRASALHGVPAFEELDARLVSA